MPPVSRYPANVECSPLPTLPRLAQCVRRQGQGAQLVLDLLKEQVHEARLKQDCRLMRRSLDGRTQVVLAHRPEEIEATLGEPAEVCVRRYLAEPVGT